MMASNTPRPLFITFTGVDDAALITGMQALSARWPIEWGVLIDQEREGLPLFPDARDRQLIQECGLSLSAHICGTAARAIAEGRDPGLSLHGFRRAQINHGREGSSEAVVANCHAYGVRHRVRVALQCQGAFPADNRVDWLYDVSFGTGRKPSSWPAISGIEPLCGYSGGLDPTNVAANLGRFPVADSARFWIDMESGVRTELKFDLAKCAAVCAAVFDAAASPR